MRKINTGILVSSSSMLIFTQPLNIFSSDEDSPLPIIDEEEDDRYSQNLVTDGKISEQTCNSPAKKKQRSEDIGLRKSMNLRQDRIETSSENTIQESLSRKVNERNNAL